MAEVQFHRGGSRLRIAGLDGGDDRHVPLVTAEQDLRFVSAQFVGQPLVLPALVDGAAEGLVIAVVGKHQMELKIELSCSFEPLRVGERGDFRPRAFENLDGLMRDVLRGASRRRRLQQQAKLVDFNEPIFGSGPNDGPHVHALGHDPVGNQTRQRLNHWRAADAELVGQLRRLQLAAAGEFAADDAGEEPVIHFVDE